MKTQTRWWMLVLLLATTLAQAGTKHYYYTDPQGTVLAKADAQGNILATYDYAPYGTQVLGTSPDGPTGYTGHVSDAETGLVYMQARYYDPEVGRFLSVDPVGPDTGPNSHEKFNRFAYAINNPIRYTDPDGRCPWCAAGVVAGGMVVGGGLDALAQKFFHPDRPINRGEVALAAAAGGITAGTSAIFGAAALSGSITVGQAVLRQAAVSATVGAGQSVAGDVVDGKPISGQGALNAAGANIIGSFVGSTFSGFTHQFAGASTNNAMRMMSTAPINSPAGIGVTIADTTNSIGNGTVGSSLSQSIFSQSSRLGDVTTNIFQQNLSQSQDQDKNKGR